MDGEEDEVIMGKYQTFWPRFWAGVLDVTIFLPISWLGIYLGNPARNIGIFISWLLFSNLIILVYPIYLHARYGQTVGKMATGVKVLDVSEERLPTLGQAFIREIGAIVLTVMGLAYDIYLVLQYKYSQQVTGLTWPDLLITGSLLGWFLLEIFSKRRAFHDFLAGTVVVKATSPRNSAIALN